MFKYMVVFIAITLFRVATAAPIVGSVSGTALHDSLLVVSGDGFGAKGSAAPVTWDNLEDGSIATPTVGSWSETRDLSIGSESRSLNSDYCGTANMAGSGGVNGAFFTGANGTLSLKWFVQYWFLLDDNFDFDTGGYLSGNENLSNIKFFRMWNPGGIEENFHINLHGWDNNAQYYAENVSNASGGYCEAGYLTGLETGVWHCVQFEYMDSSVGGNDGIFRYWRDGQLIVNDTDLMTRDTYSDLKRPYIVGFYDAWNDSGTDRDDFYIDDVYTDSTWARVELGNNSVFADCTHREIQIPTAWATDEITVTFNQGSFANADTAYVFVVDADGSVSDGYQVVLGGEASNPPVAEFSGTPLSGTAPLSVTFTDASTNTPTKWHWDFGESAADTSALQSPTHEYDVAGIYTVTLTAYNADGSDSEVKTDYITVTDGSGNTLADLSASVTTGTMSGSWTTDGAASWTVEAIPASGRSYSIWTESASFGFPVGATAYDVLVTSADGPTATTSTGG